MSNEEYRKKEESRKGRQKLIGEPLELAELKPGVMPFEFDYVEGREETVFKIEGGQLILMGTKTKTEDGRKELSTKLLGPIHWGNLVKEIIKS